MKRLGSSLEAEGAEFLVLGHLLIGGIETHKLYTNHPGYGVVAANPETNKSYRIQVKRRWATDLDGGFPIKNFHCDFMVFVALIWGYRYRRISTNTDDGRRPPGFNAFPTEVVEDAQDKTSFWGKVFFWTDREPGRLLVELRRSSERSAHSDKRAVSL